MDIQGTQYETWIQWNIIISMIASRAYLQQVDPKVQISANEYEEAKKQRDQQKGRYEQGEMFWASAMHPRVTSRILLNKWQRQKEKDY